MNTCTYTDQLDAYFDGDLAPDAARAVEEHVAGCAACVEELALAQRMQRAFQAMPAEPCPDEVFAGALSRIEREAAEALRQAPVRATRTARDRPPRPASGASRMRRWSIASAAVAGLVLLAAAIAWLRPMLGVPTAAPEVAAVQDSRRPLPLSASEAPDEGSPGSLTSPAPDEPVTAPASPVEGVPDAPASVESGTAPESPTAETTRQQALFALSIAAKASRQGARVAGEQVDDSFGHVSEALAFALTR